MLKAIQLMVKKNMIWMTILCITAVFLEFRNLSYDALFWSWWQYFPLIACIVLILVITTKNIIRKRTTREAYLPVIVGMAVLMVIGIHTALIKHAEQGPTFIKADTEEIGSDGGLMLDFKTDGFLKAEKHDHWCITSYWGCYERKGDSITLDMPFDFELSSSAVMKNDSVLVFNDSVKFFIFSRIKDNP